ncbi:MAG: APC family permease [Clostridia bacterium]|nr:APC family permease [Clostridia bacterium]
MSENRFSQNLTPFGAWAFAIGTSIGWGSLVVTSNTYLAQAGPMGSVLGMVFGAVVMLFISRNYAYMMQCYPEAGGAYNYAKEVFGHDYGFLTAWFLSLTYLAILWANATSLPLFIRYFIGDVLRFGRMYSLFDYDIFLGKAIPPIAAIVLIAWLCTRGKKQAARLMGGLAILFVAGITAVFALSFLRLDRPLSPAFVPDTAGISQIIKIAVISPWAFIGFESISHGAEEFSSSAAKSFGFLW